MLREILSSYRFTTQSSNTQSLESTVNYYCKEVKRTFIEAVKAYDPEGKKQDVITELNETQFSENHLLLAFNKDNGLQKDLVRRTWQHLMEAYKNILDLIFRNNKLESVYKDLTTELLDLCMKYSQHDLAGIAMKIKKHQITNIQSFNSNTGPLEKNLMVDTGRPETNDIWVEIHFKIVQIAKHFGKYQEAFHALESINELLNLRRHNPRPM